MGRLVSLRREKPAQKKKRLKRRDSCGATNAIHGGATPKPHNQNQKTRTGDFSLRERSPFYKKENYMGYRSDVALCLTAEAEQTLRSRLNKVQKTHSSGDVTALREFITSPQTFKEENGVTLRYWSWCK